MAVLDANVHYSAPLRDFLIRAARSGLYDLLERQQLLAHAATLLRGHL